jgi:hypothetical protein
MGRPGRSRRRAGPRRHRLRRPQRSKRRRRSHRHQHTHPGTQPLAGQPGQQAQPVRRRRHRPARRPPGADGAIGPDLKPIATSWPKASNSPAPPQWTVRLRKDIKYSDGTKVAMEDVAKALKMYSQVNGSFVAPQFPEWPKVTKKDELTFTLDTKAPLPHPEHPDVQHPHHPRRRQQAGGAAGRRGHRPLQGGLRNRGTGTYKLVVNENYWGDKPKVSEVNVRFMSEESSRVVALRSGEVDVIDSITPDSVAAEAVDGITIEGVTGTPLQPALLQLPQAGGQPHVRSQGPRGALLRVRQQVPGGGHPGRPSRSQGRGPADPGRLRGNRRVQVRSRQGQGHARGPGRLQPQGEGHLGNRRIRRRHLHHGSPRGNDEATSA